MAESHWEDYTVTKNSKSLPLKGIRVLEVCTLLLGPSGPGILSRLGAEVIKCEMSPLGDALRSLVPFGYFFKEQSTSFIRPNPKRMAPSLCWLLLAQRSSGGLCIAMHKHAQARTA